ncbi:MAG: DUF2807 domain-containing protein [Bacteroidetes bacterium]|nr:DUF2807 domain-containing protein [Bacteroidota bacterium]MBS1540741.1 DUF2807 domain-containing protein [Bacteroidota bacterium]
MKRILILLFLVITGFGYAQVKETRQVETFTKLSFRVPGKLILKQGSSQSVVLSGDKDMLEKIETEVSGGHLSIEIPAKWALRNWHWRDENKITAYVTVKDIEAISVSGSGDLESDGKILSNDMELRVSGSGSLTIDLDAKGELRADVSGSGDITAKGSCREFESHVSGSGKVNLTCAISGKADVGVSGSGRISMNGRANEIKAHISGSGKVLASDLEVSKCDVRISGSGDVEINVKDALDANISGSGSVSYKGNPSQVNSHSSGSGKVRKM